MELIEALQRHARDRAGTIAVRQVDAPRGEAVLRYGDLAERVGAAGRELRHLLPPGAVVVQCMSNRPEFWVAFYGALAAGLSVFTVSADLTQAELERAVELSGAAAVLLERESTLRPPESFLAGAPQVRLQPVNGGTLANNPHSVPPPGGRGSWHGAPSGCEPQTVAALGQELRLFCGGVREAAGQPGAGLLLASSGSTGAAKIVWRSGAALDAVSAAMHEAIDFAPGQNLLTGVPMCHSYGCEHGVLGPAWGGATVLCCNGIKLPLIAQELGAGRVNIIPGVPFLFEIMGQAADLCDSKRSLRSVYSAGAPLPLGIHDAFYARFGVRVGQVYGATEVGSVTFNDAAEADFDPMSAGRPLRGVELRVVDAQRPAANRLLPIGAEGHLALRAASMMSHAVAGEAEWAEGLERADDVEGKPRPEAPPRWREAEPSSLPPAGRRERKFLLTGDLARLDGAGRLTITGRLRLLIDIAGRKVNPVEVESVLKEHPAIGECVIVPVAVSQTVNRLKAVVTLKEPQMRVESEELRQFARQRLSSYKVPRVLEVRASLPRSPLGKILRHRLEERTP